MKMSIMYIHDHLQTSNAQLMMTITAHAPQVNLHEDDASSFDSD